MSSVSSPLQTQPYSIKNPFLARMTQNYCLNKAGSTKDTRHIVLDLAGSGLSYTVGASLGVFPKNPPQIVAELLSRLKLDPDTVITDARRGPLSLAEALTSVYALNRVTRKFVKAVHEKLPGSPGRDDLEGILASEELLETYIWDRDCLDVLIEYPGTVISAEELASILPRINPRLYSIASSPIYHPGEVHLTVAVIKYTTHGRQKLGLASGYLGHGAAMDSPEVPIYIQSSKHFHLPASTEAPIIMVGPGTGIAPFRAFLEQRYADGARGENWLFFGDQHRSSDFLYEKELEKFQREGFLKRIDTAFSRDQERKIYVQDRMRENAAELWRWIQNGAYFYVCGDAKRMAKDVHQALIDIAASQGGLSPETAKEYIEITLAKNEQRYLRDVY